MPVQLLGQIAEAGINTALGLALQRHNDQRQLKQQDKLNRQQLGINKEFTDYQQSKQLEFWEKTGYEGQMREMREHGLNPGLMYGMSGAGGGLAGGTGAQVNASKAPAGGQEVIGLQLLGAQKALLEAQTEKTKAETAKTAGPDTEIATAEARIRKLQGQMTSDTYEATYGKAMAEWGKLEAETKKIQAEGNVAYDTQETAIKQREGELIGLLMANELKGEQINLTEAQTEAMIQSIAQKWKDLEIKQGHLDIDKFVNDVANSTRLTVESATKVVNMLNIRQIAQMPKEIIKK